LSKLRIAVNLAAYGRDVMLKKSPLALCVLFGNRKLLEVRS